ncbi:MAG: hypothetical protein QM733_15535 [Ilumatobacteraceae bacterium]
MSAGSVGFVLVAAIPVALAEVGHHRRSKRAEREGRWWLAEHPDWDASMPPPRTSLRPRWESSSDPADEDDLIEFLVTVAAVVLLTGGLFFTSAKLPWFLVFGLCGALLGTAGVGIYSLVVKRHLPPGARQVIARGAVVGVAAGIALHWFTRTEWRAVSFTAIHDGIVGADLVKRPGRIHELFGGDGVMLTFSLGLGVMFAIGLLIMALVDLVALLAATRLGEGSKSALDAWMAQLYPRRQVRLWVSTGIIGLVMLLLVGGAFLNTYDSRERDTEIKPATVPIVANPPGTVVPPTTTATSTVAPSTTVAETTTLATDPAAETTPAP